MIVNYENQFVIDVEAGIARELDNGSIEYKCSTCGEFKDSFDFYNDDPLICGVCDREY